MLHRSRRLLVHHRIRLINAIRAHLAESGIVASVGRNGIAALLQLIAEGKDERVPEVARECLAALATQLELVTRQIREADRRILAWHQSNEVSQRLAAIPGVGPLTASALVAAIPDPKIFRSGRDLSAWIGLVPKQNSTGGKERLGSISKAGDRYPRQLLVTGAMAIIRRPESSAKPAIPGWCR